MQAQKDQALEFETDGGEVTKSHKLLVTCDRVFQMGVVEKDGIHSFRAVLEGELTIFHAIIKAFRDTLNASYPSNGDDSPPLQPDPPPKEEKQRALFMANQLHHYFKSRKKPDPTSGKQPVSVEFEPEGLLDGKIIYSFADEGFTNYAWWRSDGALSTTEPLQTTQTGLKKISEVCDFTLEIMADPKANSLLRPKK